MEIKLSAVCRNIWWMFLASHTKAEVPQIDQLSVSYIVQTSSMFMGLILI